MVNIQICLLGDQKYEKMFRRLKKEKSEIYCVTEIIPICFPKPEDDVCHRERVREVLNEFDEHNNMLVQHDYDLRLCFTDLKIDLNWLTIDLDNKTVLCSLFNVESYFKEAGAYFYNYLLGILLKNSLEIVVLKKVDEMSMLHKETRSCLFDMCGYRPDVVKKYSNPSICGECLDKLKANYVNENIYRSLNKEYMKLKRPIFNKLRNFVKLKPLRALFIAFISGIILNVISSFVYDFICKLMK
jgi:hypothetical protein